MAERGSGLRFAKQVAGERLCLLAVWASSFRATSAVEHLIPRAVDDTHAPFANLCKDSVMIERLSDHGSRQDAILSRSCTESGVQHRDGRHVGSVRRVRQGDSKKFLGTGWRPGIGTLDV